MTTKATELLEAVEKNDLKKVKELLSHDFFRTMTDILPMKRAVAVGHTKIAKFLLESRSLIPIQDKYGLFEDAMIKKQRQIVACLLGQNIRANTPLSFGDPPVCFAVEMCCPKLVKLLLEQGGNPNSINTRQETALYIACREGNAAIVRLLLQRGADVKWLHTKNGNFTPLIVAVANDHQDIVALVLKAGADVNAQDMDGWTALWHAYSNSNEQICSLLLKYGAKTNIPNNEGKTVIDEANDNMEDKNFIHLFNKYSTRSI